MDIWGFATFDPFGLVLVAFLLTLSAYFFWLAYKGPDDGDGGIEPRPFNPRPHPPARRQGPERKPDRLRRAPRRRRTLV